MAVTFAEGKISSIGTHAAVDNVTNQWLRLDIDNEVEEVIAENKWMNKWMNEKE